MYKEKESDNFDLSSIAGGITELGRGLGDSISNIGSGKRTAADSKAASTAALLQIKADREKAEATQKLWLIGGIVLLILIVGVIVSYSIIKKNK